LEYISLSQEGADPDLVELERFFSRRKKSRKPREAGFAPRRVSVRTLRFNKLWHYLRTVKMNEQFPRYSIGIVFGDALPYSLLFIFLFSDGEVQLPFGLRAGR
jgi:hypothetical protein